MVPWGGVFYYFGYGSNLSVVSLRAKGVDPLTSEPAVLEGWQLVFDIPDFFVIEGGTGNIAPRENESVHGALHGCREADLPKLDQLEAVGIRYARVETTVTTYSGRRVSAYVYVGLERVLCATCVPSERYRNILVKGAQEMNLDARYIERLRNLPTGAPPQASTFTPSVPGEPFTMDVVARNPQLTSLAGHVFDMSGARPEHAYMRELLGGKDVTLLFLKRMDTSAGDETFDDVRLERLDARQRAYVAAYLHEFAREYRYVGRIDYQEDDGARPEILGTSARRVVRSTHEPSTTTLKAAAPTRPAIDAPAGRVLEKGEIAREELGHENLGFLSHAHGFMPVALPATELPKSHAAWDQIAAELPALHRSLGLRRAIDAMPILRADEEHLPDTALLRAAIVLGMLSHAYRYVETRPPATQPETLERPWAEVRARLGRGPAVLTYQDLIVYNWRLLDPDRPDRMALDNLQLLIPTVDNREERTFYLTQTQILAYTSPILGAIARAQEAALTDDPEEMESALVTIIECVQRVLRESLLNIDPNPESATYVDPVVWAKTVAPFAVPMKDGVQGPSGTSSPIFNTLDVFFGRKSYTTFLGREIHQLRGTYPPLWREFIAAVQEVSVGDYVATRGNPHLRGLMNEARAIYAGPHGFLGRHRMKVYGYLELAFKVGRSVTIGGFRGAFKDRTWDQVDTELEKARVERVKALPGSCYYARVVKSSKEDLGGVFDVVLDVSGTGLRYQTGDRCGVLPENDEELVQRTLASLGATGDEVVRLSAEWRDAVNLRWGREGKKELPLRELLRFGQLRPVSPRVAEALHAVTQDEMLERAIHEGKTREWELWEVLDKLAARGFEPARLVDNAPFSLPQAFEEQQRARADARLAPPEAAPSFLCEVVPPETYRMYSIASVMNSAKTDSATELRLTVARLRYDAGDGPARDRRGVASSFLASCAGREEPISIVIQHPPRFTLPRLAKTPLVLIAGGTGVSPFRGFLAERQRQLAAGEVILYLGIRSRADFVYADELRAAMRGGHLRVHVAFSREDVEVAWDAASDSWVFSPGRRCHVTQLLEDETNARALGELLRPTSEGGSGAHVYVCGRARFARAAVEALKNVCIRFCDAPPEQRETLAQQRLRELVAEGRFMQEIFSGDASAEDLRAIDLTEVAAHNDEQAGYWIVVEGRVYDVTEYVRLHPGGMRLLQGYAGMDATDGYAHAHHARTEIDATREMYGIGVVRALDLHGVAGSVRTALGERVVSLAGAYRAWVKNLHLVIEMQNALRNDESLQSAVTTRDDASSAQSPYKLQRAVETHDRFLRSYVDLLAGDALPSLWDLTRGLFAPAEAPDQMRVRVNDVRSSVLAHFTEAMVPELYAEVGRLAADPVPADAYASTARACAILIEEAHRFLAEAKEALIAGVRVFEELERAALTHGGARLTATCLRLPEALARYYLGVFERLHDYEGWRPKMASAARKGPSERVPAAHEVLLFTKYWCVEEYTKDRVVVLRRTAVPFDSLDLLIRENAAVISQIRPEHGRFGVVVDMRQAPARNDPEFEHAMRTLRETVTERFARLAILIESDAGVLQVNRLGRGDGQRGFATMSESAAMEFARGDA